MSDTPRTLVPSGPTLPAHCTPGPPQADLFEKTGVNAGLYSAVDIDTWQRVADSATGGIQSINGDISPVQVIAIGSAGSTPNIDSVSTPGTTKINIPLAAPGVTGLITPDAQVIEGLKIFESMARFISEIQSPIVVIGDTSVSQELAGFSVVAFPNAASTGTTTGKLAKLTGAPSKAQTITTSDVDGIIGICAILGGTTGYCGIAVAGVVNASFDGSVVAGHYVQASDSVAGDCADAGVNYPTSGQVIGRVLVTASGAGSYPVLVFPPEIDASIGGSGSAEPAGIPGMLIGVSTPLQKILIYPANSDFILPLTGTTAVAKVAATAQTDFDVQVNGVSKGTIRFAIGATVGAMVSPTTTVITPGKVIEIIGPLVPDATLANVGFNLKGEVDVPSSTDISLATTKIGLTTPIELIYLYPANSSFTLDPTDSVAVARVAATAQTDFLIKVNGVTKGTIRFAASGTVASIVSPTSTSIVSGDVVEIYGPATPDLTLANIGFNLKGAT